MTLSLDIDKLKAMSEERVKRQRATSEQLQRCAEFMVKKGYVINDEKSFKALAYYLAVWHFNDMNQGLLMWGQCGVGKTYFAKLFLNADEVVKAISICSGIGNTVKMDELLKRFTPDVYDNVPKGYGSIVLDDICQEELVNDFGTKRDVIAEVIDLRHRLYDRFGFLTHFTMNTDSGKDWADMVLNKYGKRIHDRIKEMCVEVEVKGESMRSRKG